MEAGAGFEVRGEPLRALLQRVHDGQIQAPEFQRAVRLKDDWVRSLLASVSLGYPVGAVMLLEFDSNYARFATHPVAGAPLPANGEQVDWLLVDGQHRLAALYQALTPGEGVLFLDDESRAARRAYFIDMRMALDPAVDRDEAIFSVGDGGGDERHHEDSWFPVAHVFGRQDEQVANPDPPEVRWAHGAERGQSPATTDGVSADDELVRRFEAEVLSAFETYMVPTILFPKEWTRWTVRMRGGANGRALSEELGIPLRANGV